MENTGLQVKFAEFLKKEEHKKTITIVLICLGAVLLLGVGAFIAYKLFFAKEDEYDLYDELDFYYDEDDEEEPKAEETSEECGCGCAQESATEEAGCCAE